MILLFLRINSVDVQLLSVMHEKGIELDATPSEFRES